jgi:hypothetical protein
LETLYSPDAIQLGTTPPGVPQARPDLGRAARRQRISRPPARRRDPARGAEIAVADTFDALTFCRPYRDANSLAAAIGIILDESGTTFDARVVAAFAA